MKVVLPPVPWGALSAEARPQKQRTVTTMARLPKIVRLEVEITTFTFLGNGVQQRALSVMNNACGTLCLAAFPE